MSYFDHVSCPNCRAEFDPSQVQQVRGQMSCPKCQSALGVADLFGIKASFMEGDQPNLSLDDLVPGDNGHAHDPWGQPEGGHPMNHGSWEPNTGAMPGIHNAAPARSASPADHPAQEGGALSALRAITERSASRPSEGASRAITDRSASPPVRSVGVRGSGAAPKVRPPTRGPQAPNTGSALDILKKMKKR